MQIPKNILIKSNNKTVAYLSPSSDGLKDCFPDIRLNGESTLEFSLPATSEKIEEITPECEIWTKDKVYMLRKDDAVDTTRDDKNKLWAKFSAIERWAELDTSYVESGISNDPSIPVPTDLNVTIVGGGSNLSGGLYATGTAGHALYAILQGSGWTLGVCDVTGIRDLENEKSSRLATIKQIQDIWGGYLVWDSVNRIVHLRDANKWQNYTGFQVRFKKNLKHITRTESNKLVTKLYAFGHDDLDIANVNGGKKYITNHTYTTKEYVGIYKNQDIYSQAELKEKTIAELDLICRPRYLYKVKLVDLRTLPEYSHEEFSLGDMADIIDPDIAPDSPRPRIIRHKYNLFRPWECELDIGDPEERLIEQLKASFNTSGFVDGKFNGNGQMSGHNIETDSISAKKIKTDELIVGSNIAMGPDATISWGKVDDKPTDLAYTGDIPSDEYITTISRNAITTEFINAKEITARRLAAVGTNPNEGFFATAEGVALISSNEAIGIVSDIVGWQIMTRGQPLYIGNTPYNNQYYHTEFTGSVSFDNNVDFSNAVIEGLVLKFA